MRGSAWLLHTIGGLRFLANYLMSAIVLLTLLSLLSLIRRRWLFWLLFFFAVILPLLVEGNYFSVYRKFLSPSLFSVFFESPAMVTATSAANLNIPLMLYLLTISVVAGFSLHRYEVRRKWIWIPDVLVFSGFFIFFLLHWYSVTNFQHSSFAFYSSFTENLLVRHDKTIHPDRVALSPVTPSADAPNFVLVIGESQVLSHMSLYGYHRKTTPLLDSLRRDGKIIPFTRAVSVGNKTRLSIPYMLEGLEGPDPGGAFFRYPSLFNYMKAAGYHTLFISAQDLHWGCLDKYFDDGSIDLLLDGSSFSGSVDVHKGADDLVVLPHLFEYLEKYGAPFLLVVQMDGSHYPYNIHSPDSLKRFLPEESPNCVNAFDNTLLVTDLYLARLHRYLSEHFPHTWMFFTPDHGQNFGGLNGRFNDNFKPDVWHNPLIVFPPEKESLPARTADKNRERLTSQSDIFATILELAGIRPQYCVDAVSLLDTMGQHDFVTCMEYMPTFHNDPSGIVVDTALQTLYIDFAKGSVTDYRTGRSYRYDRLEPDIRQMLDHRRSSYSGKPVSCPKNK
jgi:glucan phosphoethanolaminetransferase (alkaline phosphatase superfamily)